MLDIINILLKSLIFLNFLGGLQKLIFFSFLPIKIVKNNSQKKQNAVY